MKTCIKSLVLIFLSGCCFYLSGQPVNYSNSQLKYYIVNNFSIHNQNWAISQNPINHFVYFANSEGLIEYNGISWEKHALKDNLPIRAVQVFKNGDVFTGSFEEFGFWKHNPKGVLEYNSLVGLTDLEKNDEIWKIHILDNKVFFQSFTSIYIYDFERVIRVKAPYTMLFMHLIDNKFVTQILTRGLFWFKNSGFELIKGSEIFGNVKVHAIIPYSAGKWLVCTDIKGVYVFDGANFREFQSEASDFLKLNTCNAAKQIDDSTYAFGSILNGFILTDKLGRIQRTYNTSNGLQNNTVLSLFTDSDKGLWVGLDAGANYIDPRSPITHYVNSSGTLGTIYALLKQNNQLYIGTNHGLFLADIDRKGQIYQFNNLRFIPGSQGQVWALEIFENQILCGHNEGTFVVKDEKLTRVSEITGGWTYVPYGNHLLGGTYTGIVVFKKNEFGAWSARNKIQNFTEPTRHLEVDYLGYIWAAHHQKGIYRLELSENLVSTIKEEHFPHIQGISYSIKVFKINNRVVFTTSENMYTYDYVRNQIVTIENLSNDLGDYRAASQINHFRKNDYWFIKDDKIALFEVGLDFSAKKKREVFLDNNNLPQRRIQLINMDDSTVLIPNPQNFDIYSLQLDASQQVKSRLSIEKVLFYGDRKSLVYYGSLKNVETSWNTNNLKVYFSDPSQFNQTKKIYSYRIKEIDKTWQTTALNHLTYLGLKHGNYTLELKSRDRAPIEVPFYVGKPWYLTNLAILFYFLLLILIAWGILAFFKFKISRQKELVALELKQSSLVEELDYKSYELMLTIRYLIHKNEILTELQNEISQIKAHSSKYPIKNLKSMERIISEGLDTQTDDWKNAMNNLKLSQQGFFKKLMERFPSLTTNDLRLCSYLRMNFSTKEIARLLNNSPRGVEISRYRLRKKLKLNHDINLTEFLMSEAFSDSPSEANHRAPKD